MSIDRDSVAAEVAAYVSRISSREIAPDTDFVTEGLVDSMALIEMVSWVEQQFEVSFDMMELEECFVSADKLADVVVKKRS
ncbi:MAG: acyl carrier protein [Gemmatimonadota bacterium]